MKTFSNKPTVAIVGGFQQGKSTLVNCLLGEECAVIGNNMATTIGCVKYEFGKKRGWFAVNKDGKEKSLSQNDFFGLTNQQNKKTAKNIVYFRVVMPIPFLESVDLIDTAGFGNNEEDNAATLKILKDVSFVVVVTSFKAGQGEEFAEIVRRVRGNSRPFSVVVNNFDSRGLKKKDDFIQGLNNIYARVKDQNPVPIIGEPLIVINTLWGWYGRCLEAGRQDEERYEDDFNKLPRSFYRMTSKEIMKESNVDLLSEFITAKGIGVVNPGGYHLLQKAFDKYQEKILNRIKKGY